MSSLPTVAMGLVIVFLDVGAAGHDWVADPLGWVLVLLGLAPLRQALPAYRALSAVAWVCLALSVVTWPPSSVAHLDASLGWLFSLPTLGFCFLLCGSLREVTWEAMAARLDVLRLVYAVAAVLPAGIFLAGWSWLTVPAAVLLVVANLVLVVSVWAAGEETQDEGPPRLARTS